MEDLDRQAADRPGQVAVATEEQTWTYAQLREESLRVAGGLAGAGVGAGDRVSVMMANRLELVAVYYACFRLGAIACPLNTRWAPAELAPVLRRLRPRVHLADPAAARLLAGVPAVDRRTLRCFVTPDAPGGGDDAPGAEPWHALLADGPGPAGGSGTERADPGEPAVLLGTSGTTGETKLVVHTAATLRGCVDKITDDLRQPERLALCPLPLVHAGGLIANLLTYVRLGSPLQLLDAPAPEHVLDVAAERGASYLSALPALLMGVVRAQQDRPRDLSALQRCVVAGDALSGPDQEVAARVLGAEVRQVWGATEAMGSFTYGLEPGAASRPATGSEVRLVDHDGLDVAPGSAGEMLVRGDNVSLGYWAGPGRLTDAPVDGWYRSGDLFRRGDDGQYWFVGRMKDVIVRAGSNIAPAEVEAVLQRHPAVRAAVVVGLPDSVLGQRVGALVKLEDTPSGPGSQDVEQVLAGVREFAAGELAGYELPADLRAVEDLPRGSTSKVDRRRAAALLADPPDGR